MKKKVLLILFMILATLVFSQMASDPSHPIYSDIRAWETQGLVSNIPLMRPYPMPLLKSILEDVMKKGAPQEAAAAKDYYEVLTGRPIHFETGVDATIKVDQSGGSKESFLGSLGAVGDIKMLSLLSAGYSLKVTAFQHEQVLPDFQYSLYDISYDPIAIGPIRAFLDMNVVGAIGTDTLYFQGGISRSSFGNFYENSVVLGNQAFHTGNFTAVVRQPKWMYTQSLFILGATDNVGTGSGPNKYMAMHSVTLTPVKWFNFTYYENIVYGGRFDPVYLLPFIPFMVGQSLGGYEDNLQMGIAFQFTLIKGLKWNTDIMIDDINMNDIVKLKFDTKIRIAAQTGLVWAPPSELCKLVTIDYTMIVPYMYSHPQDIIDPNGKNPTYYTSGKGLNYQNYTTNGMSLGSNLPPNSDRFAFSLVLKPVKGLDLTLGSNVIRVANQNETINSKYAKMLLASPAGSFKTDGSIFNQYRDPEGWAMSNAQGEFGFMTQPTKMYVWQTSLDAAYSLPRYKWGTFTFKIGYTFEFIKNAGVNRDIFPGKGSSSDIDPATGVLKPGVAEKIPDSEVYAAIESWKNALKTLMNHYFRISVKYNY